MHRKPSVLQFFRSPETVLCGKVTEALLPFEVEDVRDAVHIATDCLEPDYEMRSAIVAVANAAAHRLRAAQTIPSNK